MQVKQGDVFWIDLDAPLGSEPGYRRPHVVVQNNVFSSSGVDTFIVCALTTNLRHARSPWNVLLRKGEANLPRQSVVNVSQMYTVDRRELEEKIGSLTRQRIRQIFQGIRMIIEPTRHYHEL